MSERSTRRNANRSEQAKSSLAGLLALRESGKKRVEQFECAEEEDIYDMVEEKDYADLVAKRRKETGGFVVDDDGLGYALFTSMGSL
eukprot:9488745-Pyramimonas_sp.AAC.2